MSTNAPQDSLISTARLRLVNVSQSTFNQLKTTIDNVLPPERQENLKQTLVEFTNLRPILATFVLSQVVLSGIPLVVFIFLTAGVFIFSLAATLVLGILGALVITLLSMGLGSLILIPTLFITTFFAGGIWLWAWSLYYIVQWVAGKDSALLTRVNLLLVPQKSSAKED